MAGTGSIINATINASGTVIEPEPENVTIPEGVTAVIAGEEVVGGEEPPSEPVAPPVGPVFVPISAISVEGVPAVGQTLAAKVTPENATVTYQWMRSDSEDKDGPYTNISGATEKTYRLASEDVGRYIKVKAIGTGNYKGIVESESAGPVVAAPVVSTYKFSYTVPTEITENEEVSIDVTFATDEKGDFGYDKVRFEFAAIGPEGATITFKASDSNEVEHTFTNEGVWGPAEGFEIPAEYTATTTWKIIFDRAGEYIITFKLINLADGAVITEGSETITVEAEEAPDTTSPELVGLIAYLSDGTSREAEIVEGRWTLEWTVGEKVTKIEAAASESVRLVEGASAVVTISGPGISDGTEYGTIAVDEEDPTKVIIKPNPGNETAGLAGEFTFTVAEGVLEDLAGNKNAETILTLTVDPPVDKPVYIERTGACYSGIQSAINESIEGDMVIVAPGEHVQDAEIIIPPKVTLKLNPEVVLKFAKVDPLIGITVNGTLIAEGTESEKIVFTSSGEEPVAGDWKGISFGTTAKDSKIDNCIIEYARVGINVAWTTITEEQACPLTITNNTLKEISNRGVQLAGWNSGSGVPRDYKPISDIVISGNTFVDVGKGTTGDPMAIYTASVKNVNISNNTFQGGEGTYLAYLGIAFDNYVFENNTINNPGYNHGIFISTTTGAPVIEGNVFRGTAKEGFRCIYASGHAGMTVEENGFYCGSSGVYMVWFKYGLDQDIVKDNIFDGVGTDSGDSYAIVDSIANPQFGGIRETVIEGNTIKNTKGVGIYACFGNYGDSDWGTVTITNNAIETNRVGIRVGDTGTDPLYGINGIEAHSNKIVDNEMGVQNIKAGTVFDAVYNYWGHESGPKHDVLNPDGQGNPVSDNVEFSPWYIDEDCNILADLIGEMRSSEIIAEDVTITCSGNGRRLEPTVIAVAEGATVEETSPHVIKRSIYLSCAEYWK